MKRKLLVTAGIIVVGAVALLAGLTLFVKSYLKSETIKSYMIPKAEELTGRRVTIDTVQVSVFRGIVVKGIAIKERDGVKDFASVKEFIFDYRLLPLLRKQLTIARIELTAPYIALRKSADGTYNFSDIVAKVESKKDVSGSAREGESKLPFSVVTDKVYVRDARIDFSDASKTVPEVIAKADLELALSSMGDIGKSALSGLLTLKELRTTLNGTDINTTGRIDMGSESMKIDLTTQIGKDKIAIKGSVKEYMKSPDIQLNAHARELDLEKIASLGGDTGRGGETGKRKSSPTDAARKEPTGSGGAKASGEVTVDTGRYNGYAIKDFKLHYRYSDGGVVLDPISMHFSGGDTVKAEGTFKGDLRFRLLSAQGVPESSVKKSAAGKGVMDLSRCEVSRSKVTDAIALLTGVDDLKSPSFDRVHYNFTVMGELVYTDGTMESSQVQMNPKGTIDFDQHIDILSDVKLSPNLSSRVPAGKIISYSKDEKGWSVIPIRIGGTVRDPAVSLNTGGLGKHLERGITGEIGKRIFKEPSQGRKEEQPSKTKGTQDLLKGIFGR